MRALSLLFAALPLAAQSLEVYSEFRRVNAKGAIVEPDLGGKPREILSPALVRNGWHTFHLIVRVPAGRDYALYVVQNPDRLEMKLYRELPDPNTGIMERLRPEKLTVNGKGGGVDVFLLDVHVPTTVPAGRVRIEAQMHDGYNWYVYPMEVRVFAGIVPGGTPAAARLPDVGAPSVESARQAFREYACQEQPAPYRATPGVREMIRRNALQDVWLAQQLEAKLGREALLSTLTARAGVASLCGSSKIESPYGPEWYLRIRDYLFRESSH